MAADLDPVVTDQIPAALALAMTLTGDPTAATELVAAALAGYRPRGRAGSGDPVVGVRDAVVQRFATGRLEHRRPVADALHPTPVTDATTMPTELAPVAAALGRLTPLARSVLVLSLRERITHAEIAGILDRPAALVTRTLDEALATVDAPTGDIVAALDRWAWAAPEPPPARAAAVRALRQRARRRRRISALVAALIGLVVLALVAWTVVVPRLFPIPVRQPREWASGFAPTLPAGWTVSAHYLQAEEETYVVGAPGAESDCLVSAKVAGPATRVPPAARRVQVNRRPGWYGDSAEDGTRTLTWSYAPGAEATVACNQDRDVDRQLLELARSTTFRPMATGLPFRLPTLPAGFEVLALGTYQGSDPPSTQQTAILLLGPAGADEESEETIFISLPGDRPETRNPHTVRVQGAEAVLENESGYLSLCLPVQSQNGCLQSGSGATGGRARQDDPAVRRLLDLAEEISFATDIDDPATWIDAREAVPR